MTADLMSRLEQLQQELDAAQQIANNNYRLYTQVKEQRDELLEALKATTAILQGWEGTLTQRAGDCVPAAITASAAAIAKAEGR